MSDEPELLHRSVVCGDDYERPLCRLRAVPLAYWDSEVTCPNCIERTRQIKEDGQYWGLDKSYRHWDTMDAKIVCGMTVEWNDDVCSVRDPERGIDIQARSPYELCQYVRMELKRLRDEKEKVK